MTLQNFRRGLRPRPGGIQNGQRFTRSLIEKSSKRSGCEHNKTIYSYIIIYKLGPRIRRLFLSLDLKCYQLLLISFTDILYPYIVHIIQVLIILINIMCNAPSPRSHLTAIYRRVSIVAWRTPKSGFRQMCIPHIRFSSILMYARMSDPLLAYRILYHRVQSVIYRTENGWGYIII